MSNWAPDPGRCPNGGSVRGSRARSQGPARARPVTVQIVATAARVFPGEGNAPPASSLQQLFDRCGASPAHTHGRPVRQRQRQRSITPSDDALHVREIDEFPAAGPNEAAIGSDFELVQRVVGEPCSSRRVCVHHPVGSGESLDVCQWCKEMTAAVPNQEPRGGPRRIADCRSYRSSAVASSGGLAIRLANRARARSSAAPAVPSSPA